jgi:glycosyl transferase family 87
MHSKRSVLMPSWFPLAALLFLPVLLGCLLWYSSLRELITGIDPISMIANHYDFLAFYTAAKMVAAGQVSHLYDNSFFSYFQFTIIKQHVGTAGYMPFMNPPFVAVFLAGLAWFSEPIARSGWFIANTVLAVALFYYFAKTLAVSQRQRFLIVGLLMSTVPLYASLIEGQLSIILLAGCALALRCAERGRLLLSGGFLAVLWLKPQLALLAIAILAIFRGWKIIGGLLGTGFGLALIALPVTGFSIYFSYGHYLTSVLVDHFNGAGALSSSTWTGRLDLTAGINGLFTALFGQPAVKLVDGFTALFDGIVVAFFIAVVRQVSRKPNKALYRPLAAISVGIIMLIDPHLYRQDVILIYLLLPLLGYKLKRPLTAVISLVLLTDLLVLDYFTPLHVFTIALFGITMGLCWRVFRQTEPHRPAPFPAGRRRTQTV